MCSGGLDSSLITALAARAAARAVHGVQRFRPEPARRRRGRRGPRLVADSLGVELCTVEVTPTRGVATSSGWCATSSTRSTTRARSRCGRSRRGPLARRQGAAQRRGRRRAVRRLHLGRHRVRPGGFSCAGSRCGLRRRELAGRPCARMACRAPEPAAAPGADSEAVAAFEARLGEDALAAYGHHRGTQAARSRRCSSGPARDLPSAPPEPAGQVDDEGLDRDPGALPGSRAGRAGAESAARASGRPSDRRRSCGGSRRATLPAAIAEREKVGFGFDYGRYLAARARPEFLADGMLRDLHGMPAAGVARADRGARMAAAAVDGRDLAAPADRGGVGGVRRSRTLGLEASRRERRRAPLLSCAPFRPRRMIPT